MTDSEMKIGGISVRSDHHGIRGDFHASGVTKVQHHPKKEAGPGPNDHGCHEFNVIGLHSDGGVEFTLYLPTDQLVKLVKQGQKALDGIGWEEEA